MKKQRGSIIIFSVIILTVVTAATMTLTAIFVPKIRTVGETINSAVAIYSADSAAEMCLYEARQQPPTLITRPLMTNGATFTIASISASPLDITPDCTILGSGSFEFRAVGTYNGVSRALELTQ
ncbi:MAG: hypothetical protein AAB561_01800 [Patescibacteria group bacterium]